MHKNINITIFDSHGGSLLSKLYYFCRQNSQLWDEY